MNIPLSDFNSPALRKRSHDYFLFGLFVFCSILILTSVSPRVFAATYKCADENGDITYSQTPCKKNQKTDKVMKGSKNPHGIEDCKYAGAFSKLVFRKMRSGKSTQQLFDSYGGVSSISKNTLGVINYVYSFKYSTDIQSSRVSSLTFARCNALAFGEVKCENFPTEFQEMILSCDDDEREEIIRMQKMVDERLGQKRLLIDPPQHSSEYRKKQSTDTKKDVTPQTRPKSHSEQVQLRKCQRYESDIETIDNRMSKEYTISEAENLREKRKNLTRKLSTECR